MSLSTPQRTPVLLMLVAAFAVAQSCTAESPEQSRSATNTETDTATHTETVTGTEAQPVEYLDPAHPELIRRIEPKTVSVAAKFVEVEITEVANPRKYGLAFDVHFQTERGERVPLGSFSLFPADNPGRFIVPAADKLDSSGSIVVSMQITDAVSEGDPPRVGVRNITVRSR